MERGEAPKRRRLALSSALASYTCVALTDDTVLLGSSAGSVYVYERGAAGSAESEPLALRRVVRDGGEKQESAS